MQNPREEITGVIHALTQSAPSQQRETIETYFTPRASFTHPFCRTGSWEGSRLLIRAIYRWYKIMSPRIEVGVRSVAYDEANLTLYVQISQVFRIWIIPFYRAPVDLTTVLKLQHNRGDGKYYIQSQDDLYQSDQLIKFIAPGGWILVWLWQCWATFFCLLGAVVLWPVTLIEESRGKSGEIDRGEKKDERRGLGGIQGMELQDLERKSAVNG